MRGEGINTLVEPDKIQHWIPGKITFDSCRQAWDGMGDCAWPCYLCSIL